jgi:hypothetical protein
MEDISMNSRSTEEKTDLVRKEPIEDKKEDLAKC